MKIAILGCRGIPGRYGGFETLAEQLSARLAARGHAVVVYCRRRYVDKDAPIPMLVARVFPPAIYAKHWETLSHTFFGVLDQCLHRGGVALLLNNANAIFIPLLRLFGKKVFVHVDGLEWQRGKWGLVAKAWHRLSERMAARWAHGLISDSYCISDYYERVHGRRPAYAAYGTADGAPADVKVLTKHGLKPHEYFLFVGRMEPENHPDLVIEAHAQVDGKHSTYPLVMVGWAPYAKTYERRLRALADSRVRFLGGIYGEDYRTLLHRCYAFVHAPSVGGTHPVLVEALGSGRPVLTSDIPENRETAGKCAIFFGLSTEALAQKLRWVLQNPGAAEDLAKSAKLRAREKFDWDKVADAYEKIFQA